MVVEVAIRSKHSKSEVEKTINQALKNQTTLAQHRRAQFERLCAEFEEKFGFTSDKFLEQFEAGELGDEVPYFDWFAAKRGFDLWDRKYHILTEALEE